MKNITSLFRRSRRVRAGARRDFRATGHPNGFGFRFPGWRHTSAAIIASVLIGYVGAACGSRAALIAEDSFDYLPAGDSLHGKNGGAGWAAPWATNSLGTMTDSTSRRWSSGIGSSPMASIWGCICTSKLSRPRMS